MKKVFVLLVFGFSALFAQESSNNDQAIRFLKDRKMKAEKEAVFHENQGNRLQFIEGQLQYAKRHFRAAEASRKMAADIQKEIDKLEAQKSIPAVKKEAASLFL